MAFAHKGPAVHAKEDWTPRAGAIRDSNASVRLHQYKAGNYFSIHALLARNQQDAVLVNVVRTRTELSRGGLGVSCELILHRRRPHHIAIGIATIGSWCCQHTGANKTAAIITAHAWARALQ